jgi:hypothetical protein
VCSLHLLSSSCTEGTSAGVIARMAAGVQTRNTHTVSGPNLHKAVRPPRQAQLLLPLNPDEHG